MGDLCSIPGLGRSPGEGKGYLLQYSGLENSMECIVHGVTKSRTRLSDFHFHLFKDTVKRVCENLISTQETLSIMWTGLALLLKGLTDIAEENNHDKHESTSSTSTLCVLFTIPTHIAYQWTQTNDFPIIVFISLQEVHVLII